VQRATGLESTGAGRKFAPPIHDAVRALLDCAVVAAMFGVLAFSLRTQLTDIMSRVRVSARNSLVSLGLGHAENPAAEGAADGDRSRVRAVAVVVEAGEVVAGVGAADAGSC
jgi:hypothetical protein